MPGNSHDHEWRGDDEKKQREDDKLGKAIAGEAEAVAPAERGIRGMKPVAADVAGGLQVARVHGVVGPVGAIALAFGAHAAHITGPRPTQPSTAPAVPPPVRAPAP